MEQTPPVCCAGVKWPRLPDTLQRGVCSLFSVRGFSPPLATTDDEAIMGVEPASIDPNLYNAGNRFSVMYRNSQTKMTDVSNGTSNTIMVVECAAMTTNPTASTPAAATSCSPMAMCNWSVSRSAC
jgi:hypothetical protein